MLKKILLCLSILIINAAYADNAELRGGHPFIDLSAGYGYVRTSTGSMSCNQFSNASSCSSSIGGFDWNIMSGYLFYQNRFAYGGAIGYTSYPNNSYVINYPNSPSQSLRYKNNYDIDLLGIGKFFITQKFSVLAGLGATYLKQQALANYQSTSNELVQGTYNNHKIAPTLLVEFIYGITPHISVEISTQYTMVNTLNANSQSSWTDSFPTEVADTRRTNIGLIYTF